MRLPGPLRLLLAYEGYPPGVLVALVLHGGLLWFLLDRELAPANQVDVERPPYIQAAVIQENPQQTRRQEQVAEQRAREQAAARARAEEERRRAEREQAERQAREQAAEQARRQQEAERQAQREAERRERDAAEQRAREEQARRERERQQQQAREQAQREERERAAREAEAARQREEAAAAQAGAIATYTAIIRQTVENNWSRPPSARNGMSVLLRIQLVPTGEVVDVTVLQSSGDAAFDRSAEQAVWRARRFPELRDMNISLFDREFRTFNLLFRPQDLLRDL